MNSNSAATAKGSILIVDDSPDNLRALSMTLTKRGYKTRCVTNGEMALISIGNFPPDLILLDIRMPLMDGYEVCRQLKANPDTESIPIIFLSAADDLAGKVKAFEMGGADYIAKPFQTEEVLARIAHQLTIQRLQNQLIERNRCLQREIADHKLTEAALQDAKEAAEVASYAKSEFLARMSHELRTPLNAILGFAELLRSDPTFSKEQQDYLASISQSGEQLLKLFNHILAVTSASTNNISLNEHDFDLYQLVHAIASIYQPKANEKGLQLIIELAPAVPRIIHSDESKLHQVLVNLLENAIQFTQQGKVILRVNVGTHQQRSDARGDALPMLEPLPFTLFFEIEDTGSGIAADEMSRLFQMFSQTESGRRLERGMGLGAFISRQFVQVMGGDITIASMSDQGTIARFYILVHPAQPDAMLLPSSEPPSYAVVESARLPLATYTEAQMQAMMQMLMPIEWHTQLHHAAIKGVDRQISQLIHEIPGDYAPLIRVLMEWNENFQFERIVAITQRILTQSS